MKIHLKLPFQNTERPQHPVKLAADIEWFALRSMNQESSHHCYVVIANSHNSSGGFTFLK